MPAKWRPNNKVTFQQWQDCARCGLPWPKRALVTQRGVTVCPECFDEPSHEDNKAGGAVIEEPRVKDPWIPDVED